MDESLRATIRALLIILEIPLVCSFTKTKNDFIIWKELDEIISVTQQSIQCISCKLQFRCDIVVVQDASHLILPPKREINKLSSYTLQI